MEKMNLVKQHPVSELGGLQPFPILQMRGLRPREGKPPVYFPIAWYCYLLWTDLIPEVRCRGDIVMQEKSLTSGLGSQWES